MTTARKKKAQRKKATRKTGAGRKPRLELPKDWPAANVEPRKVSDLVPYARNPKIHSDRAVSKLAAAIKEWGWTIPVLIDDDGTLIAGHRRVLAAEKLGIEVVPTMTATGWSDAKRRAYVVADNRLNEDSDWDQELLSAELQELQALEFDLAPIGFEAKELQPLLFPEAGDELSSADDAQLPGVEKKAVTKTGDLWLLGNHRLLCGDSTRADDVARLMRDDAPGEFAAEATCIMADPPYGMGKEKDGVANDNLYREKLDAFQMEWWKVAREHLAENGSAYVWGNAPDLWRLWYVGGLGNDPDLMVRNELVWDKGAAFGMKSAGTHSYPPATERCLFLMRGQQFIGNQNKEDYWEGWEPLRVWLVEQRNKAGWKTKDVNRITGTHMAGHWFTKSQFQPISEKFYDVLHEAAGGAAFVESYDELFGRLFPDARDGGNAHRRDLSAKLRETRTPFDASHEAMTDVWRFNRVHGEERFGHATPKPVAMIGRAIKTSVPQGELVLDPFSGTGTALVACELLGRVCYALELEPLYVDVAIRRWQEQAGDAAKLASTGETFARVESKRRKS